ESGGDRRGGIAHRGGAAAASAAPLHVGERELRQPERGSDPRWVVPVVAVGGEAVDLARVDAGVARRAQDRLERQLELRIGRLAVLVVRGLADAGDGDLAAEGARLHATGYYTGPRGWFKRPFTRDRDAKESPMGYQEILYAAGDGIATVTLNRPEKLNAWTLAMGQEVRQAMEEAERDQAVRGIVLT